MELFISAAFWVSRLLSPTSGQGLDREEDGGCGGEGRERWTWPRICRSVLQMLTMFSFYSFVLFLYFYPDPFGKALKSYV